MSVQSVSEFSARLPFHEFAQEPRDLVQFVLEPFPGDRHDQTADDPSRGRIPLVHDDAIVGSTIRDTSCAHHAARPRPVNQVTVRHLEQRQNRRVSTGGQHGVQRWNIVEGAVTLQERVLEALGEKALKPQALYTALSGESPSGIEDALRDLMKRGIVSLALGHYQRAVGARKSAATPIAQVPLPSAALPAQTQNKELTKREREIYELVEGGLTAEEIAKRLGTTRSNVYAHSCVARKKLRATPSLRASKSKPREVPVTGAPVPKQSVVISTRIIQAFEGHRRELTAAIEALEADIASKREELLDLAQFLNWLATQTGRP